MSPILINEYQYFPENTEKETFITHRKCKSYKACL